MDIPENQIEELRKIAPNLSIAQAGGFTFILIEKLNLAEHLHNGCKPDVVDALLCPMNRDGYESSLFFSSELTGYPPKNPPRNWNNRRNVRILDRNWFAISWKVQAGLRLAEMFMIHLNAFR